MKCLCHEVTENLEIYEKNYLKFTKCLIRGSEILLSGKPEELVRQNLLYLLTNDDLFPDLIDIKVEYNNLDIAVYKRQDESSSFKPLQSPLMIVEVKRNEENLLDHKEQLITYLKQFRSKIGLIANCKEAFLFRKDVLDSRISDISEIKSFIRKSIHDTKNDCVEFEKARAGDIKSFVYLIENHGKYSTHQITFKLKSNPAPIVGCLFKLKGQNVYFDIYGNYAKKQKFFKLQDFEHLVSIVY
jgi:hypothetical protein